MAFFECLSQIIVLIISAALGHFGLSEMAHTPAWAEPASIALPAVDSAPAPSAQPESFSVQTSDHR